MLVFVNKENLKEMRQKLNLSQRKLSLISGLPVNAVKRMETEDRRVSSLRLLAVATTLGCSVTDLMHD